MLGRPALRLRGDADARSPGHAHGLAEFGCPHKIRTSIGGRVCFLTVARTGAASFFQFLC